jgi:hypothetical protein
MAGLVPAIHVLSFGGQRTWMHDFLSSINVICPVQSPLSKIFRFRRRANQFYQLAPSFPGKRGGSRVVTNAGSDAVDATASARNVIAGRILDP